jgi:hypothetical protein
MNSKNKNIEEIDAYLAGDFTKEEQESFQTRLLEDVDLKNDLVATQKVIEGVEGYAFKQTLGEIHADYSRDKNNIRRLYYSSAIAASVLLLVAIFFTFNSSDTKKYYAYFKPYPGLVTVRSDQGNSAEKALEFYDREEFAEAIIQFEKIPKANLTDDLRFFEALSYLGIKKLNVAQSILENLSSEKYKEQISWYLSLCYLMNANKSKAKEQLLKIKIGEFEYERTQEILKDLN